MTYTSKQRGKDAAEKQRPAQSHDRQPGRQHKMTPQPRVIRDDYQCSEILEGNVARITGGDSGIGQSVAVRFAHEGGEVIKG